MSVSCQACGEAGSGNYCAHCGAALAAPATAQDSAGGLLGAALFKVSGIGELLGVLASLHRPLRFIRSFVDRRDGVLRTAMFAYIELVLIMPAFLTLVVHPVSRAIGYPSVLQGAAIENQYLYAALSATAVLLGTAVLYALPSTLFAPSAKRTVLATNLIMAMYCAAYITLGDVLKALAWVLTADFGYSIAIGTAIFVALVTFQIFVWRRVLRLRWLAIVVLILVGVAIYSIMSYTLASFGLWSMGPARG